MDESAAQKDGDHGGNMTKESSQLVGTTPRPVGCPSKTEKFNLMNNLDANKQKRSHRLSNKVLQAHDYSSISMMYSFLVWNALSTPSDLQYEPELGRLQRTNRKRLIARKTQDASSSSSAEEPVMAEDNQNPPEELMNHFLNPNFSHPTARDPIEDLNRHISKFLQLCNLIKANGVPAESIRLMLFPFSLKGRALNWLELQPADSISTWEELVEKFQKKFFPLSRFSELKEQIGNFKQLERVRLTYRGSIREITPTRAIELIEKMASEDNEVTPVQPKRGVMQLEGYDALLAKQDMMDQRLDSLVKLFTQNQISAVNLQFPVGDTCGGPYSADKYEAMVTINPAQVNSLWYDQRRENNPYNNTYNPGWRNHSTLSYNQGAPQQANMRSQPAQSNQKAAWEVAFEKMAQSQANFVEETRASLKNQEASIKNLEIQIGQLAKQMAERPPGTFPSTTIINPKEQCNAIITRKSLEIPIAAPRPLNDTPCKKVIKKLSLEERIKSLGDNPYVKAPYPQRLQQHEQKKNFSKFLEIFKKLHINIPFAEALEQMPSYAKFLKEILTKKRKLTVEGSTILTEECSAITQKNLPPKLKDPGSFSIPCTIGSMTIERFLCDLGAAST
ncbi:uncharacterized protein LOC133306470 [Gastrolobium bilobum]|uniref:uncharacterized protein LOC133306470 n=1 Tax=Gastrolobium bilobum TaxID=150636 RepID=UPI002AB27FA2|nr:uncharacterized protein LOC133306470 [Gastrolobium bilobum]